MQGGACDVFMCAGDGCVKRTVLRTTQLNTVEGDFVARRCYMLYEAGSVLDCMRAIRLMIQNISICPRGSLRKCSAVSPDQRRLS
jgi:hypothetical protein